MAEEVWEQPRTLPLKQRTALALYYVGDLTEREVADVMQVVTGPGGALYALTDSGRLTYSLPSCLMERVRS